MSIAKKVAAATAITATLALSVLTGAKFHKPINGAVNSVQTKISNVFTKKAEVKPKVKPEAEKTESAEKTAPVVKVDAAK